jgi:hypothetical protein
MSLGYITVNEFPRCSLVEWGARKADLLERQLLAQMRSAGCLEQCPSLRAKRMTYTRPEFFHFEP